jgi:GTP-binding protein
MSFIDELHISAKAGNGGDGVVRWLHLKGKDLSGPAGGDGGRGGGVYAEAVRDISALSNYTHQPSYAAGNGGVGAGRTKEGANGKDFVFMVPVGTVITNKETGETFELLAEGDRAMILAGGGGGRGNAHFKGSRNTSPTQFTEGKEGEQARFDFELQLVVDAGFVGFPNAGKSSLLNVLTGAKSKVANYAFTTLNPKLGVLYGYILADIPGLIEGAAGGKGLGHTFLRHVKRTKLIAHCVSFEHEDMAAAYRTIRAELAAYNTVLAEKPELVICTKADLLTPDKAASRMKTFAKEVGLDANVIVMASIYDDASIKKLSEFFVQKLDKEAEQPVEKEL